MSPPEGVLLSCSFLGGTIRIFYTLILISSGPYIDRHPKWYLITPGVLRQAPAFSFLVLLLASGCRGLFFVSSSENIL